MIVPRIKVKYNILNDSTHANSTYILESKFDDFFRIDELLLSDISIDSIKPDAAFLFKSIDKLEFDTEQNGFDTKQIKSTIAKFERIGGVKIPNLSLITLKSLDSHISAMLRDIELDSLYANFNSNVIDGSIFNGLENLTELKLNVCKAIETISDNSFQNVTRLRKLQIDFNEIALIKSSVFNCLVNLEELTLKAVNEPSLINLNGYNNFNKLRRVELVSIGFDSSLFENDILSNLSTLEDYSLNYNQIKLNEENLYFQAMPRLAKLNLSKYSNYKSK
jgi:hypothetical protein